MTELAKMNPLTVRRPLIDLNLPVDRHWCAGDAFRTAFFNALSMSFPVGEQFFIDSVHAGLAKLSSDQKERFQDAVRGFIGQEASHRRLHILFNEHLARQGLVTEKVRRLQPRIGKKLYGMDEGSALAATAAFEHFTAILADWMLRHPQALGDPDSSIVTLWLWHASEEFEHKCLAFDLYQAYDGSHKQRVLLFRRVTVFFIAHLARQTVSNLRRDRTLWHWSTWRSGFRFLFGAEGLVREMWPVWQAYTRIDFHPSEQHSRDAADWLANHSDQFRVTTK